MATDLTNKTHIKKLKMKHSKLNDSDNRDNEFETPKRPKTNKNTKTHLMTRQDKIMTQQ